MDPMPCRAPEAMDHPVQGAPGERAPGREAPLAMGAEEFRRVGHHLVDVVAGFLETLPERPVARDDSPGRLRDLLDAGRPLPELGADAGDLLDSAARLLFDHSLFNGHPRFFGYVTASPAPIGMLAEFLAAAVNANVGAWRLGPMATEIESQAIRWIAELIGYPNDCGGLFVSGGNMANFTGLLAARLRAAPWGVREEGFISAGAHPLRVYASPETHTWIQKATDLAGLGTGAICWIDVDQELRMDPRALEAALDRDLEMGIRPLMVVGTAGTVSTGAVDPLEAIGEICRKRGIWFHVDGAYGAFAAVAPEAPEDLRALAAADSVAVDPHKWLYAPLEAGCILVRDPDALRSAFSYHPPYYHFGQEATNYVDFGPQNSRGFRALKVWLALQQVGRSGYRQMIGDDMRLSRELHALTMVHPELEACTQQLSISTFRYVPRDLRGVGTAATGAYLNDLNERLLERIQASGELFVSNAVVGGRFLLRACIVNFHSTWEDLYALVDIVARLGRELDAELRAPLIFPEC